MVAYFAGDWRRLVEALGRSIVERRIGDDPDRRLVWFLALATISEAIAGALAEGKIDDLFRDRANQRSGILVIALVLMVMGVPSCWRT